MTNERRLPGFSVLGCGYDATGQYANAESVRWPIFDLGEYDSTIVGPDEKTYSVPSKVRDKITLGDIEAGEFYCFTGESAETFRTNLNNKVEVSGSYGLFSGSVTTSFEKEQLASFNHEFVCVRHTFTGWVLALPEYSSLTMIESAKKHIEGGMDPEEVIHNYGTHVLVSAVIGGRAEYSCFVDRSKFSDTTRFASVAKASYGAGLKVDAEVDIEYKKEVEEFKSNAEYKFRTIGGEFGAEFKPDSFAQWMRSFKEHPVLIDFTGQSLVEIYNLASTEERKKELEAAYTTYIEDSQRLVPDDMPLIEVEIVTAQSVDFVANDAGSGAGMDLVVYRPMIPSGWNWLGHSASNDMLIRVRALVPGAVSEPLDYHPEWTDRGSGNKLGYSLWNVSPQPRYRALGGIARLRKGRTDWAPPSGEEVEGLVCIHESLCTEGEIGGMIWNDAGTGASTDGSVWEIKPQDENGFPAHTFFAHGSHSKPAATVYVIKRGTGVTIVD